MWKIIRKRLVMLIFVIFGVSMITFIMTHIIPGDPARKMVGQRASEETYQSVREQLGLNDSLLTQYINYMKGLFQGDLGTSIVSQQSVLSDLVNYLPATVELVVYALVFAVFFGLILGVLTAINKNGIFVIIGRIIAITGISVPIFLSALIVIIVFYGKLGWMPASGRLDLHISPPVKITGLYTFDSIITGNLAAFKNSLWHLVLPAITLGFVQMSTVARQVRSSMIDIMNEDFIRTAYANGLPKWFLIIRYALRNALIPTITVIGIIFGTLLGGAVVTEIIFNWPGMGKYVVNSIQSLDFPAIMGFTLVISVGYVIINLIIDLLYIVLDPQIRE